MSREKIMVKLQAAESQLDNLTNGSVDESTSEGREMRSRIIESVRTEIRAAKVELLTD